jgi:nicotinamidase/pyrazinamidase
MHILAVFHLQNDFCAGGILEHPGTDALIQYINSNHDQYDQIWNVIDEHPVSHISFAANHPWRKPWQYVNGLILWPMHGIKGTYGAENPPSLIMNDLFKKVPFGESEEDTRLNIFDWVEGGNRIDSITFCGTNFTTGIYQSAIGALELGIKTLILEKFCFTIDELQEGAHELWNELRTSECLILNL